MSTCSYCRRPILWGMTSRNRPIPLQLSPDRSGSFVLVRGEALTVEELQGRGEPWDGFVDGQRYHPHRRFCPAWPKTDPKPVRPKVVIPVLSCTSCGLIDDTVRNHDGLIRCVGCRRAEQQEAAQGVLV